jgi:hypothetical protein
MEIDDGCSRDTGIETERWSDGAMERPRERERERERVSERERERERERGRERD